MNRTLTISLVLLALAAFVGYLTLFTVDHFNCCRNKSARAGNKYAGALPAPAKRRWQDGPTRRDPKTSELAAVGHGENANPRSRRRTLDDA